MNKNETKVNEEWAKRKERINFKILTSCLYVGGDVAGLPVKTVTKT